MAGDGAEEIFILRVGATPPSGIFMPYVSYKHTIRSFFWGRELLVVRHFEQVLFLGLFKAHNETDQEDHRFFFTHSLPNICISLSNISSPSHNDAVY